MPRARLSLVRNAELMPLRGVMDEFVSGVFSNGQCLPASLIHRASPSALLPVEQKLSGTYIFGGYLFGHFGHFLLESLSRLYAFQQCRDYPILFMNANDRVYESHVMLFRFLKVRNEILDIHRPTAVEQLIMSDAGSTILPPFISDAQLEAFAVYSPKGMTDARIWLSRSGLGAMGGVVNESELENELEKMGWLIVHPQDLPYMEQARLVSSSRYVAGFDGSAFYSALFADRIFGRFFMFSRRNHIPEMLSCVMGRKGIPCEEHVFPVRYLDGESGGARYYMENPERILEILKDL